MERTERINRINDAINAHFKSNHDAWWVNNDNWRDPHSITLHHGIGGDNINPVWVALFIMRTEPSVNFIYTSQSCYTRSTLRRAGYKI